MEGSVKELASYRLERAKEMLTASEKQLEKAKAFVNAVQEYMKQNGI